MVELPEEGGQALGLVVGPTDGEDQISKCTIASGRGYTGGVGIVLDQCWLNGIKSWGHVKKMHGEDFFGGNVSEKFEGE